MQVDGENAKPPKVKKQKLSVPNGVELHERHVFLQFGVRRIGGCVGRIRHEFVQIRSVQ